MDAPPFCENKSLYRVICLEHIKKEQAIREAVFSAQMEGLRVTAETERRIRKILDGELTVEERVQQLKSNARRAGQTGREPPEKAPRGMASSSSPASRRSRKMITSSN